MFSREVWFSNQPTSSPHVRDTCHAMSWRLLRRTGGGSGTYQDHNEYSGNKHFGRPINRCKSVYTANHRTSGLTLELDSQTFLPYTTSSVAPRSLRWGSQPEVGGHSAELMFSSLSIVRPGLYCYSSWDLLRFSVYMGSLVSGVLFVAKA